MASTSAFPSARSSHRALHAADSAAPSVARTMATRRAELEARWRETLERVTSLSVAYHDAAAGRLPGAPPAPTPQQGAGPPSTQGGRHVSRLARRVVAERQTLAEIEAALDRIAAGQYGRCEQCHGPISAPLLAAQPEARFCSACSRRPARVLAYA